LKLNKKDIQSYPKISISDKKINKLFIFYYYYNSTCEKVINLDKIRCNKVFKNKKEIYLKTELQNCRGIFGLLRNSSNDGFKSFLGKHKIKIGELVYKLELNNLYGGKLTSTNLDKNNMLISYLSWNVDREKNELIVKINSSKNDNFGTYLSMNRELTFKYNPRKKKQRLTLIKDIDK
jgi:hypothetical protein